MKTMTILAAAATLFAGASSAALAGQHDYRDRDDIRRQMRELDREIAQERHEMAIARANHDWDKLREDRAELNSYLDRRTALRNEYRGDRRFYRRYDWR